ELDDDAHAVLVGLVAQAIGGDDAFYHLVAYGLGDALEQARLVDLIRRLGDDARLTALLVLFDRRARAHVEASAAGEIGRGDLLRAVDDAGSREIRTGDVLHQAADRDVRIVDEGDAGADDFAQVVRRDVRGHADRDAGRAVDEQIRHARGQYDRFLFLAVVVVDEIDRLLVDVGGQLRGKRRHAALGVSIRRGRIAVDGAEVALAVDEQVAHRERLRHAHERIVGRGVAVRVVLAEHVADDARALHVGTRVDVVRLVH